ncbi:MAG TPA: hypothetical protein VNS32_09230 [Flavisolibacter sp.]|nr:hypothetical protein [Flavisolibacter sp.]
MITIEQYLKAQELIKEYEQQISSNHVLDYTCIACKKATIQLDREYPLPAPLQQEDGCWKNGSVASVYFGYGSKNDGESFYVAICDQCIVEAQKQGYAVRISDLEKQLTNNHS